MIQGEGSEERLGGKERGDVLCERRKKKNKIKFFYTKRKKIYKYKMMPETEHCLCIPEAEGDYCLMTKQDPTTDKSYAHFCHIYSVTTGQSVLCATAGIL